MNFAHESFYFGVPFCSLMLVCCIFSLTMLLPFSSSFWMVSWFFHAVMILFSQLSCEKPIAALVDLTSNSSLVRECCQIRLKSI